MAIQSRLWCVLALLLPILPVSAGSIQLTPVSLKLSPKTNIAVLTVKNTGTEESVMQVSLNKWTLQKGQYQYEETQDLVITPATFRLAPGGKQIVRVGLRNQKNLNEEIAYRMLVEEVPKPSSVSYPQMQLVVRHDLPVFVAPNEVKAVLDISLDCKSNSPNLRVTNIGNIHSQIKQISIKDSAKKQELGKWSSAEYLLVGAQKSWDVKAQLGAKNVTLDQKTYAITALTDVGSFTANVANTCL
jgi:fimbrial chaperone protein